MQARYISEWSVVKHEGKIGVLIKNTPSGKPWVKFGDMGVEINKNTELEVVKYPTQLADEYIESLPKENETCTTSS